MIVEHVSIESGKQRRRSLYDFMETRLYGIQAKNQYDDQHKNFPFQYPKVFLLFFLLQQMACKRDLYEGLPKGNKRGQGKCPDCGQIYSNRRKPKNCSCGYSLGGMYSRPVKQDRKEIPESVIVHQHLLPSGKEVSIRSVKTSTRDTRAFAVDSPEGSICFVNDCKDVRGAFQASEQLIRFSCQHLVKVPVQPDYSVVFSPEQIKEGVPDEEKIAELLRIQNENRNIPAVVKVSERSYAVLGDASSSHTLGYVHVRVIGEKKLECSSVTCKRAYGRTKQVCIS